MATGGIGAEFQNPSLSAPLVDSGDPALLADGGPVLTSGDGVLEDSLEAEIWAANDPSGNSYWPFMPYLSQLESLPQDFDMSNLE